VVPAELEGTSEVFAPGSWMGCLNISKITTTMCMNSMGPVHLSKTWYGRYDKLEELSQEPTALVMPRG
jgi:hypothetical protein